MMDLKKAYQAIHTSPTELHLRQFFFRRSTEDEWRTFAYTRANFGDLSAGLLLEIGKRKVANLGKDIDPVASQQLKDFTYVDDGVLGGTAVDVMRMRGVRENGSYTGTVAKILSRGGMSVKFMAVTGSSDDWEEEQLAGKNLGVHYDIRNDEIKFSLLPCYYSDKSYSSDVARELILLDERDISALKTGDRVLSRRMALSMVMGVYDPLGLISAAVIKGKILLRRLYTGGASKGWDADIVASEKGRWADWFGSLLVPLEVRFPRSTKPEDAVGCPRLVGFCDAADEAMCAVLYVVWSRLGGSPVSNLLIGKCRVTPLLGSTIPRSELQSLVILHRLALTVMEAFPARFCSFTAYTDSMASIGALAKASAVLKPYFANRVSEVKKIQVQLSELTDEVNDVRHVAGILNPADWGMRGQANMSDLGLGSVWQSGPAFLSTPFSDWPCLSAAGTDESLPEEELRKFATTASCVVLSATKMDLATVWSKAIEEENGLGQSVVALVKTSLEREKLELSVKSLARVLRAVLQNDREVCRQAPSSRWQEIAVFVAIRASSASSRKALATGKLQSLGGVTRGGVVWVSGRVRGETLAELLGTRELPILLATERLSKSILHKSHRQDHRRSPQDIAARSRRLAWIIGATRTAKSTASKCFQCRLLDKKRASQLMGQLPAERTAGLSPFEVTALDLFGPFKVKDVARGRRSFKCWVVAYACMCSKAVSLLPCPGYSTDVFVTTHQHFTGVYGHPKVLYTDHAPSLVRASESHDWSEIASAVSATGTEWRLTAKGCSWRNGLAERVIRSARHTLAGELVRGELVDFHKFGAILAVVSAIINSRPLSLRTTPDGDYHAISPRDLLLGRAGKSRRRLDTELDTTIGLGDDEVAARLEDDQAKIVRAWRHKWLSQVFVDMVPRSKWRHTERNVQVGDVGHILYEQKLGEHTWRVARVSAVKPSSDGIVRTITVSFRPRHVRDKAKKYQTKRPLELEIGVQRFAVLLPLEEQSTMQDDQASEQLDPSTSETTEN